MSFLLLDTSTPICKVVVVTDDGEHSYHQWQADRALAKGLLAYIESTLREHNLTIHTIKGIGVFQGPGSFTGLRIGMTIVNTIADTASIPIVGSMGEDWAVTAEGRLRNGENDQVVLPVYGSDARITMPRK